MTQHYRPFIKQNKLKVGHLHIHLRPREFKDELYKKVQKYETDLFSNLKPADTKKYKELIRD